MAHWLGMRYGISDWKARRWIAAAHALEDLPLLSEAFASGELGIDKVVELTRFATPKTEARLIPWARGVSWGCIRRKGDLADRSLEEAGEAEHARTLSWWYFEENSRFGLSAELPAAPGGGGGPGPGAPGLDPPGDAGGGGGLLLRPGQAGRRPGGPVLGPDGPGHRPRPGHGGHPRPAGRARLRGGWVCHRGRPGHPPRDRPAPAVSRRVQMVIEDSTGHPVGLGRTSGDSSAAMLRQLRYRDAECTFPGCGARRFTQAHHIVWWERGGRTDLDNLILVCSFYHKLVHEFGWRVRRDRDGRGRWFHPDGTSYRAGPGPPGQGVERQPALSAVGA